MTVATATRSALSGSGVCSLDRVPSLSNTVQVIVLEPARKCSEVSELCSEHRKSMMSIVPAIMTRTHNSLAKEHVTRVLSDDEGGQMGGAWGREVVSEILQGPALPSSQKDPVPFKLPLVGSRKVRLIPGSGL